MPASRITVRNVDPALAQRLRALSEQRGQSMNATVLTETIFASRV